MKDTLAAIAFFMKKFIAVATLLLIWLISAYSQHTVVLKSGEKMKGVVLELKNDTLLFYSNAELKKVYMAAVSSMFFDEFVPYDGAMPKNGEVKSIKSGDYHIEYIMKGRTMTTAPIISNPTENRGVVVVEVTINRNGNVMKAKPGAPGSTTSSEYLYTKAEFAARGARFDVSKTGPVEQEGTITITY